MGTFIAGFSWVLAGVWFAGLDLRWLGQLVFSGVKVLDHRASFSAENPVFGGISPRPILL
jgi:hypothetical protein